MKTKNNLTTGILIGIGVIVLPLILMSSSSTPTTNNGITYGTPESHVWEIYRGDVKESILLNKVTGETKIINLGGLKPTIGPIKEKK